jgi:hypothetical protein
MDFISISILHGKSKAGMAAREIREITQNSLFLCSIFLFQPVAKSHSNRIRRSKKDYIPLANKVRIENQVFIRAKRMERGNATGEKNQEFCTNQSQPLIHRLAPLRLNAKRQAIARFLKISLSRCDFRTKNENSQGQQ